MPTTNLKEYHRNYINICEMKDGVSISTYYKYNGKHSIYVFFVNDYNNIYVETSFGSIVIRYADIREYAKLYVYYIISLQLTPIQSHIYYCDRGYKGQYKETRNWYILTNICWKSQYMSFGDYCYFTENPYDIALNHSSPCDTVATFIDRLNEMEDPFKICDWLINYETNLISNELYQNEEIIEDENNTYSLLQIVKKHFNINEDIILKIYQHIVFEDSYSPIIMI
jgi:hypothetical protein